VRWRTSVALVMLAWAPLLISAGIVIVPSGMAGVRVSQTKGTLAGTLYPGVHFVVPLVERVELFNTRDQLFTTGISEDGLAKGARKAKRCASRPKKDSPSASPSPSATRLIPSASTTLKPICRSRWKKKSCRPWSPPPGANWCRATRCAKFSPPSAKKFASAPPK
jgi:hypothetical protein